MKYFYISVILFIIYYIINYSTDMSQISFSFIRHVTTVIALFRKKKYFSLKALKEILRNLKKSSVSDLRNCGIFEKSGIFKKSGMSDI